MDTTVMSYKGFQAKIMEAERLLGENDHALPSGSPLPVYQSDLFVDYPKNWMKGPGVFVVPVKADKGLWFDWTMNDNTNTAVLPTVKGCNPITGLQTSGFHLERYENKCPKHQKDFQGERFCPDCDYRWQPQNYVAYPNVLWWDTWCSGKDGIGRQFYFTEDPLKDISDRLIGKENTVPAFGFAFYRPKEPRPSKQVLWRPIFDKSWDYSYKFFNDSSAGYDAAGAYTVNCTSDASFSNSGKELKTVGSFGSALQERSMESFKQDTSSFSSDEPETRRRSISKTKASKKEVSVGAGAKIKQGLQVDPYPLESWNDKPDAVMTIYFVFQEKFEELKANGFKNLEGKKEGMLAGLPVG